MEIATVQIGNLIIGEPMTSLTDIIIAVTSFTLFFRIRDRLNESYFYQSWRMFFLFMGISTTFGTVAHALNGSRAVELYNVLFQCMTICSSVAVFYALQATISFMSLSDTMRRYMHAGNVVLLFIFIAYTIMLSDFEIFKLHAGGALFIIFLTHLIAMGKNHWGSGWIVSGMLLSFFTVFIHSIQFSISRWFNYKDISHVIMVMSLLFIYMGIKSMHEHLRLSVFRARMANR